jgi:polyphosphate glucokinase
MDALGIDVGGSGIKAAIVNPETGTFISERFRILTPDPATPKQISAAIMKLVQHFQWTGNIGCGFPAVVQDGIVRTAANIDNDWIGTDIAKLLSQVTNCPVKVLNDADAAGIAELEFGSGKDQNGVVIIITVGTGIGTSIFSDRQLLPNTELGHLILNNKDAEHYASDNARKQANLSWKKWSKRFNKYLNELERLFWPDLFIIGGGVSKKYEKFAQYLSTQTKILPAQLLNDAGIIGAAFAACKIQM